MSWTDKQIVNVMKYFRDKYKVKIFVETGTFKGLNVIEYAKHFEQVFSCEKNKKYFDIASNKIQDYWLKNGFRFGTPNIYNEDSVEFLKWFRQYLTDIKNKDTIIIYLDAHFYDKNRPSGKGKFVVLDELKALRGFKNCIIAIHDFDNNLGHITYDEIPLDMKLVKKDLLNVNPNFKFYTNTLTSCNPLTIAEVTDKDAKDNLIYAWSLPRLTYRGILYALPTKLTKEEINGLKLREWN